MRSVLVPVAHALVATTAVGGVMALIDAPFGRSGVGPQLVNAAGIVALIWAYAGLLLGLLVGIRPLRRRPVDGLDRAARTRGTEKVRRPQRTEAPRRAKRPSGRSTVLDLHRQLNVTVLALTLVHALAFAVLTPGGTVLAALVPGIPGPQSFGFSLGVLALYLGMLLGPSYYLRDRIGRRAWLVAHQLAAFSYALALWHALGLGADLRLPGIGRTLTWMLQLPLLALFALRLFRPRRPADQLSATLRRGRYAGRRHTVLRVAMATGLLGSALFVLVMALLATRIGQHSTN